MRARGPALLVLGVLSGSIGASATSITIGRTPLSNLDISADVFFDASVGDTMLAAGGNAGDFPLSVPIEALRSWYLSFPWSGAGGLGGSGVTLETAPIAADATEGSLDAGDDTPAASGAAPEWMILIANPGWDTPDLDGFGIEAVLWDDWPTFQTSTTRGPASRDLVLTSSYPKLAALSSDLDDAATPAQNSDWYGFDLLQKATVILNQPGR